MTKSKNATKNDVKNDDPFAPVTASDTRKTHQNIQQIICNKFRAIRNCEFDFNDVRMLFKVLRKKIGLNKSPHKKGYGKFLTDEERR